MTDTPSSVCTGDVTIQELLHQGDNSCIFRVLLGTLQCAMKVVSEGDSGTLQKTDKTEMCSTMIVARIASAQLMNE